MTWDPKTMRCQILFALALSLTLAALWTFYRMPASILPILIFIQWMPDSVRAGP
jgi:ABC-type polysaccharide/polyol phosphate export permease